MELTFGWFEMAIPAIALLFGSLVFSATGFGIGMIATPIMLIAHEPQTVIVVSGTAGLAIGIWIISKSWRDIPFRDILPITIAAVCGVPIAVTILTTADSGVLSIGIAVLIILFAIGSFVKFDKEIPYSRPVGILAGFVVGVLLPTSGVAGSLVMLYLMTKNWQHQTVRAAMAFFLVVLMLSAVIGFAVAGLYTPERITLLGIVAVPSIVGLVIGARLVGRIDERMFNYIVIGIIIVSSVVVLGQEFASL